MKARSCAGRRARSQAEFRRALVRYGRRLYAELGQTRAIELFLSRGAPELWLPEVAIVEQEMRRLKRVLAKLEAGA